MKRKSDSISTLEMECAVAKYYDFRKNIIVPNISWGFNMHECDLLIVRKSGYAIEVEIKISRSDLIADFKKKHNHIDKENRIVEFYYAITNDIYQTSYDLIPENAGVIVCERSKYGKKKVSARVVRNAKRINNARKLTIDEQLKVARLGSIRVWSLKDKIFKYEKNK